jgi:hypothetical protein
MNFLRKNKKTSIFLFLIGMFWSLFYLNATIMFLFKNKIMVHRVNSIEKLNEVKNKFIGVELDLMYNDTSNFFDVNHPPAPSIDLDLKEYLSQSNTSKDLVYWFDFKNIDESNKEKSLLELNKIVEKLRIPKNKIIVESSFPELIQGFKTEGYKTSYYLPPFLYDKSKDSLEYFISEINTKAQKFPTNYMSFDSNNYPIVAEKFPDFKKISWYSNQGSIVKKIPSKILLYKILLDKNVDFVLLPFIGESKER